MKKFLVVLFVAGALAATLFAQGAAADAPHCTLGYYALRTTRAASREVRDACGGAAQTAALADLRLAQLTPPSA